MSLIAMSIDTFSGDSGSSEFECAAADALLVWIRQMESIAYDPASGQVDLGDELSIARARAGRLAKR